MEKSLVGVLLTFLIILIVKTSLLNAQTPSIENRVFVLGNSVDIDSNSSFYQNLKKQFIKTKEPFTLLLIGDLLNQKFNKGAQSTELNQITRIIDLIQQFPNGKLVIIPGDRDWNQSGKGGYQRVIKLEKQIKSYLESNDYKRVKWAIKKGCPGPKKIKLNENLTLIAINTQWWNHPYDKPQPSDGTCKIITHHDFLEELDDIIEENKNKNVILAGHYPIYSLGNYGGHFSFFDHLNPIPVFGSFRTAYRANIGTDLDISNENFTEYVNGLTNLTFFRNNLLYISGHEKNQQIIRKGNNYLINSGAPTSSKFADWETDALLSEKTAGIIELMFFSNGLVKARLLGFENSQEFVENNEIVLYKSGCDTTIKDDKDIPTNLSYVPCRPPVRATTRMSENYSKTIKVAAGNEYEASELKEFWLGGHYRDSWVQSVEVSYLDLDTSFGGLFIYKKGGGRQTTSLKFKTPNGSEYVFRSVNKDPAKSLNYRLRPTFAATMIRDQTSTQQPYGALAVDILLDELDILHAHPKLYVLPDDAKLGPFRDKYANLLGMLEEKPGKPNDEGVRFGNADKILKSQQLFRLMYEDIDNKVLSNEFIRARIFDIWVGDWSKHEDNWKWAGYSQNDGMIFRPIPRDRDHVFSRWDGVLPWLADREWASKNGENFDYKIKGLNSLVHQATNLDRLLTVEATKEDWLREAKFIQQNITDEIIDKAINNMPPEIYNLSGIEIASKLKTRLNDLDQYATEHYLMLSKEVDIVGSVKNELFNVLRNDNGTVTVSMFKQSRDSLGNPDLQLRFYRVFLPDETKEIRLYGLRGDDSFNIDGSSGKSIKIRIIGGAGDDAIIDRSDVSSLNKKTLIYDKGKSSFIVTGKEAKVIKYWNREIYKYDRNRFEYNSYTPRFLLGYNTFNGFSVKVGANFSRRNFTKEDYSSKHKFILGFSSEGNRSFIYQSAIHDLIRKWDLIISGSVAQPEFYNYFFGVGNKTIKEDSIYGLNYHKAKYNCYQFSLGFVRDFWKESKFSIKFGIENNKVEKLKNTILYDSVSIYGVSKALTIIPVEATLDLDFRDGSGLPYNGTRAYISYHNGTVINDGNNNYGVAQGFLEYYATLPGSRPLTIGLRAGGSIGHDSIPFYKQVSLGSSTGLRGYYYNRFTGESSTYFNSELRFQFMHRYTSVVPIKVGAKVFYDIGRVYSQNETGADFWHDAYGFGFYLVPFTESITIAVSIAFSDEESFFPKISIGTPLR